MPSRPYTHRRCAVCRQGRNFKYLPNERDEYGRTLMVCTRCNHKFSGWRDAPPNGLTTGRV